jgi:hypothetical protein
MRARPEAVAHVVGARVAVVAARDERRRLAGVARLVARGLAVGRRSARIARVAGALAGLAGIGAVAEDRIVTRRAVGLELADAASDVVAVVAVGALVAVEAGRALPHELAVELAAAEREVAVRAAVALRAGGARGGARVAVAEETAARVALLAALDDAVAADAGRSGLAKWNAETQNQEQHADRTS